MIEHRTSSRPSEGKAKSVATEHPYTLHTLPNGLRIVIERMPDVRSAAAGFLVRTGARDETAALAGVSHFLEHMVFKGTDKRAWQQITVDFDAMGSTYNAFTSEDRTVFYGWVRKGDIDKQLELLVDMMRPSLPSSEFEVERKVVLEEIAMAKDNLEHLAFDFLQEKVFAGHPLAWPILGYEETVAALQRDAMWEYFQRRYAPDNMLLVVAGNVEAGQILELVEKYSGEWNPAGVQPARAAPVIHGGTDVLTVARFKQQVLALSFPSVSACDPRVETADAVATILGGENSRFFWNIIQKGLAPRAGVVHLDYADCGLMILYAICQPEHAETVVAAMRAEAERICENDVDPDEVQRVKNKRRTGLAVECEVPYHRLTQLMDDLEQRGYPRTVEQMLSDVDAVSVDTVRDYLREFPIHGHGHLTSVGPRVWPDVQ